MSLYKKFDEKPKGDSFRIPENPTKYSDVTFMNKVSEASGQKSVMSDMMKTVKTYQTSTTSQVVTTTNPGSIPGSK